MHEYDFDYERKDGLSLKEVFYHFLLYTTN